MDENILKRPFLKWPGGKYRLLSDIAKVLPQGKRLVEPFVGSGAVFLNQNYEEYLLTDANRDLIELYQCFQQQGLGFIDYCEQFFSKKWNQKHSYYECRERFNNIASGPEKSALFLYLNRHGYNGLCRYNKKGGFNVPFGSYQKVYFPRDEMTHFYQKAKRATFACADFLDTFEQLRSGDVIYCDPPYVSQTEKKCFTAYMGQIFTFEHQRQLADSARQAAQLGMTVVVSNHKTSEIKALYHSAQLHSLWCRRTINRNGDERQQVEEYLAVFKGVSS